MRRLRRWLGATSVVLIAVMGIADPASAHAQLESSLPDPGSVLLASPSQVVLHFGEPVEIDFGSLRVIGPDGRRVDLGGTHHPPGDDHAVAISLPRHLPHGTYVVAWRVISADSHPVHGAFIFSVGTASGVGKANALATDLNRSSGSGVVGALYWLIRFAAFTSLVLLIGVPTVITLVWRPGGTTRRIAALVWISWVTLMLSTVAGIAVQGVYAAALPLADVFRPSLFSEVLHTRFGQVEAIRVVLLAAFVPVVLGVRSRLPRQGRLRAWGIPYGVVVGIGLLSTPGFAGHASTGGDVAVGMTLDVLHLGAVAVWFGGLAVLCALLIPDLAAEDRPDDVSTVASTFSAYAFLAVVVVVATGVIQSVRQVGSTYALVNTAYGRTLLVKIGLVIILIVFGALSRRIVLGAWAVPLLGHRGPWSRSTRRPSLAASEISGTPGSRPTGVRPGTPSSDVASAVAVAPMAGAHAPSTRAWGAPGLRRSVAVEALIAVAVLAVTALLVNAVPAKQAASEPFSQSFNTLGVQVNAVISPAKVGPGNQFHFYVLGRLGQPVAIPELDASISLPAQGLGPLSIPLVVATVGHFRATDVTIPLAGQWILKLTVRTTAIDETVLTTTVPVH